MINILRAPMENVENGQDRMGNASRKAKTKKESKENARNQTHSNRNEEYL